MGQVNDDLYTFLGEALGKEGALNDRIIQQYREWGYEGTLNDVTSSVAEALGYTLRYPTVPFMREAWVYSFVGEGSWYILSPSYMYTDLAGTIPVTAQEDTVGRVTDIPDNGNHLVAVSDAGRPLLKTRGGVYCIEPDFVDDAIIVPNTLTTGDLIVSTPYGWQVSAGQILGGVPLRLPMPWTSEFAIHPGLTAAQITQLGSYFSTDQKYMIALSPDTVIANMRIYTGGATTDVLFIGANGATVTKSLSLDSDTSYDVSIDGLTAPVAVVYPDTLTTNTALVTFYCYSNQLTGSIPSLSANTALVNFYCFSNQLTGSIPSLTANTALGKFFCHANQLTGSIPSLSANTALGTFYCYSNQLTGWAGGAVSATLGDFRASNNLLPEATVDALLAAFVAAGRTSASGTCVLSIGGTGNAAPSAAGLVDKAELISRGWTVTTN